MTFRGLNVSDYVLVHYEGTIRLERVERVEDDVLVVAGDRYDIETGRDLITPSYAHLTVPDRQEVLKYRAQAYRKELSRRDWDKDSDERICAICEWLS